MNKIEKSKYEGYIWKSDQPEPEIISNNKDFELNLDPTQNPFVIEGQLYDKEKSKSISIKYVDGQYLVKEFTVNPEDFNHNDFEIKEFIPNRMDKNKVKKIKFIQYWREEKDPLCEGMSVLQPKEFVFVGFKNKEK